MKRDVFFSIIVPVFQKKEYLEECVNSVVNQDYGDWELILVDDGSTDGSEKLCDFLGQQDERIRVIHQKNSGVGVARNQGLYSANGKFILFLDADDTISETLLSQSYAKLDQFHADLLVFGYSTIDMKTAKKTEYYPNIKSTILDSRQFAKVSLELFEKAILHCIGTKMYLREIVSEHKLHFQEEWNHWEDIYFTLQYMKLVNQICIINEPLYCYNLIEEGSLWSSTYKAEYCYETFDLLKSYLEENNVFAELRNEYYNVLGNALKPMNISQDGMVKEDRIDKYRQLFMIENKWLSLCLDGKSIFDSILAKNANIRIAIYGFGYLGRMLLKEAQNHEINIDYVIDRRQNLQCDLPVYSAKDELPVVDLIIVTPLEDFQEIKQMILEQMDCEVISLGECLMQEI